MKQSQEPEIRQLNVTSGGARLDKYVADACTDLTRTHIQKLIESGNISVNGAAARSSLRLKELDRIDILIPPPEPSVIVPKDILFEVIYEDTDLIVINKPAGLAVHPSPGHASDTLVNALLKRFPDLEVFGSSLRPGIVHRLDKDTSGLMVIARNEASRQNLMEQFKSRTVVKGYLVLVKGTLSPATGAIDAPIGRNPSNRKRMAVVSSGRPARTDYRVRKYIQGCTLLEARIHTGRTHQIRVHFAAIGFPLLGDVVYGVKTPLLRRQFLHSYFLQFKSPGTGETLTFKIDLPDDLSRALHLLSIRTA
jgi:23S rRNA pseudouridine1911/1915/1917 synthase